MASSQQPATTGSSQPPSQQSDYLRQYGVHIVLEEALSALLERLPHDPVEFLIGKLQERKQKQIPVRERLREVDVQKRLRHIYPLFLDKPVITQEGYAYAAFPLTDFYPPLMPHYLEDMADCLIYRSGLTDLDIDCVVSIASRGAGPLAHVCSQRLGVTYTLCNWYPEGSVGDIMVEPSAGFSGKGSIFLNSVVAGHRVLFVDDVLRTGHTSRSVMRAVKSVGATVVAALFVGESTGLGGRECLKEEFPDTAITTLIPFSCAGARTTPDPAFAHNHHELLQGAERPTPAQNNTMRGDGLHAVTHYFRPLADYELAARLQTLLKTFVGIPIQATPHGYPYSNFCLTDFVPLMNPELVEHIADACYAFAKEWFDACDVIVSESDRGGGPMTHACALRAQKPYCLANWYSAGTDMSFGHKATVGYSGEGRIFVNGVSPGQKVVVVDDMLSSGGTAEGLFRCIEQAGGEIICSVFASEKINQKGRERLARSFPHVRIQCLCSFNASGEVTTAGEPKFPVYADSVAPPPPPRPTPVAA